MRKKEKIKSMWKQRRDENKVELLALEEGRRGR